MGIEPMTSDAENEKDEAVDTTNVRLLHLDDQAYDEIEDIIDIAALTRTFIDEACLPTPYQEIFADELDPLTEEVEHDVEMKKLINE